MANKKRIATSVAAVATAAALLLGGTFAWQSISQTALNEASDVINPGGRLHDDFDGSNKDVYVENFAEDEIFARVRLEEYFEIVMNKGTDAETVEVVVGTRTEQTDKDGNVVKDDNGKTVYDKNGAIFTDYTSEGTFGAANVKNDEGEITDSWWSWTTGGETQYLPTFNLNKDSLAADINGTYAGPDGVEGKNAEGVDDKYKDYEDYSTYTVGDPVEGDEIYDYDANDIDEGDAAVEGTNIKTIEDKSHAIAATANASLMSMAEWQALPEDEQIGDYWVYDEDGWVYYAKPIAPHTATGLLLDGIELNQVMDDSWYYAINVVGQFITADDMGKTDGTGFYNTDAGAVPSPEALALLKAIGVNTDGPVMVSNAEELKDALANGEDVVIDGVIETTAAETHKDVRFSYDFLWHDGGTMSGGTLNMNSTDSRGLFINNEIDWPEKGDGANEATLSDTTINAKGVSAVYVQAIDAPVNLENVTITSDNCGLYVNMGSQLVTLNNVTIDAANEDTWAGEDYFNSAVAVANPGNVIINSGTYTAENDGYAVYVFNTGGTVTINGGTFNGKLGEDAGELIIKGGTFDHDPTAFVDTENYTVTDNGDGTWTVSANDDGGESGGNSPATNPPEEISVKPGYPYLEYSVDVYDIVTVNISDFETCAYDITAKAFLSTDSYTRNDKVFIFKDESLVGKKICFDGFNGNGDPVGLYLNIVGVADTGSTEDGDGESDIPAFTEDNENIDFMFNNMDVIDSGANDDGWGAFLILQGIVKEGVAFDSLSCMIYDAQGKALSKELFDQSATEGNLTCILTDVPEGTKVGDEFTGVVLYTANGVTYGKSATVQWNGEATHIQLYHNGKYETYFNFYSDEEKTIKVNTTEDSVKINCEETNIKSWSVENASVANVVSVDGTQISFAAGEETVSFDLVALDENVAELFRCKITVERNSSV